MAIRTTRTATVANVAAFGILGQLAGSVVLGLPALPSGGGAVTELVAVGIAVGGVLGLVLGALVSLVPPSGVDAAADAPPAPTGAWAAVAAGSVAAVVVATALVWSRPGFFDEVPCEGAGTLLPVSYRCATVDGTVDVVGTVVTVVVTAVALAGSAAIFWGLRRLAAAASLPEPGDSPGVDGVLVVGAVVIAALLALDGALGVVALLTP